MSALSRLRARYDMLAREMAKFGTVGAIAFSVDLSLLNLLNVGLGVPELRSKVAAALVATCVAFALNRQWTFRHREQRGLGRDSVLFFGLNAVGLAITLAVIAAITYGFGLRGPLALNVANILGTGLGTLFRFWSYRRYVWLHPDQVVTAAEDGDVVAAVVAVDLPQDVQAHPAA
ncbi:MAG TPA: GtrA family protein [Mycobacteriales bacterium]|nr:GtrA family protein [Mycobacteriales bacterium]